MADFDWSNLLGNLASAGASIYTAKQQQKASQQAADTIAAANASAQQQASSQLSPYSTLGTQALSQLSDVLSGKSNLSSDPGTLYAQGQAQKAIERAAAARGNVGSARTMSELMRSANDYAQTGYGNAFNRLSSLAGLGQTSATNLANLGTNLATGTGQTQAAANLAGTNSRLSGYQGVGNALSSYLSKGGGTDIANGLSSLYSGAKNWWES